MTDRHDIVVYGATSFVGRILTRYLFEQYGVGRDVNWAIAARSGERLAALRAELGPDAARLPIIVAEASDVSALDALCAPARVVVSTVGPYALHGEPLVAACVRAGIDYCDLTGEVQWIRRMIVRYEAAAVASGARIVHCCGFDSIPSDLGVHFLQGEMRRRHGRYASTFAVVVNSKISFFGVSVRNLTMRLWPREQDLDGICSIAPRSWSSMSSIWEPFLTSVLVVVFWISIVSFAESNTVGSKLRGISSPR